MNKEEQYLLFALSAPMEILNQGCKPAHDSPKMYTGIKEFDLSSSWGINNRDDLIQTIGNDSNLLIVFYVQIMPDDFVMQLHR
ncbi:DUF1266 domain-containing protein, partial [Escherichia coli]